MKKPKYIKIDNFTPPITEDWVKKFRKYTRFKTKYGKLLYRVSYIRSVQRWSRTPYVILTATGGYNYKTYYVDEHNHERFIPVEGYEV